MSFRKERKFRLTAYEQRRLRSDLLARGMTLLYPGRRITSQYFDNTARQALVESEEGCLPRRKLRARWYGEDRAVMQWECKVSSVEGRYKATAPLSPVRFAAIMAHGHLDSHYGLCRPVMEISYERSYFDLEGLRVTFDTQIRYRLNATGHSLRDFETVVEIKAPIDTPEDVLEALVPVPATRFSKYARSFLAHEKGL